MRAKRLIQGLNNSQKIRVIVDGVGFVTTVQDVESMPFVSQRIAVHSVLAAIGTQGLQGLAARQRVYTEHQGYVEFQVQVDLI
jgi:nitrogen-specific signal transduction histidine kinase